MRFLLDKTSDWSFTDTKKFVELDTLEKLLEFISENGSRVVIEDLSNEGEAPKWQIEIYDDWRE